MVVVLTVTVLLLVLNVAYVDGACMAAGDIAGLIFGIIFGTLLIAGLVAVGVYYFLKKRRRKSPTTPDSETGIGHLKYRHDETDGRHRETFAYDNPYFKDIESGHEDKNGHRSTPAGPRIVTNQDQHWDGNGNAAVYRIKPGTGRNGLHSRDDNHIAFHSNESLSNAHEVIHVPLKSHDFTGLGFDVWGSMRDGIYVRSLRKNGPAMESGRISAGDRILSVRISFDNIAVEDAMTILSYGSPYEILLELQKSDNQKDGTLNGKAARLSATMERSDRKPKFHPLLRSQSFRDVTAKRSSSYQSDVHTTKASPIVAVDMLPLGRSPPASFDSKQPMNDATVLGSGEPPIRLNYYTAPRVKHVFLARHNDPTYRPEVCRPDGTLRGPESQDDLLDEETFRLNYYTAPRVKHVYIKRHYDPSLLNEIVCSPLDATLAVSSKPYAEDTLHSRSVTAGYGVGHLDNRHGPNRSEERLRTHQHVPPEDKLARMTHERVQHSRIPEYAAKVDSHHNRRSADRTDGYPKPTPVGIANHEGAHRHHRHISAKNTESATTPVFFSDEWLSRVAPRTPVNKPLRHKDDTTPYRPLSLPRRQESSTSSHSTASARSKESWSTAKMHPSRTPSLQSAQSLTKPWSDEWLERYSPRYTTVPPTRHIEVTKPYRSVPLPASHGRHVSAKAERMQTQTKHSTEMQPPRKLINKSTTHARHPPFTKEWFAAVAPIRNNDTTNYGDSCRPYIPPLDGRPRYHKPRDGTVVKRGPIPLFSNEWLQKITPRRPNVDPLVHLDQSWYYEAPYRPTDYRKEARRTGMRLGPTPVFSEEWFIAVAPRRVNARETMYCEQSTTYKDGHYRPLPRYWSQAESVAPRNSGLVENCFGRKELTRPHAHAYDEEFVDAPKPKLRHKLFHKDQCFPHTEKVSRKSKASGGVGKIGSFFSFGKQGHSAASDAPHGEKGNIRGKLHSDEAQVKVSDKVKRFEDESKKTREVAQSSATHRGGTTSSSVSTARTVPSHGTGGHPSNGNDPIPSSTIETKAAVRATTDANRFANVRDSRGRHRAPLSLVRFSDEWYELYAPKFPAATLSHNDDTKAYVRSTLQMGASGKGHKHIHGTEERTARDSKYQQHYDGRYTGPQKTDAHRQIGDRLDTDNAYAITETSYHQQNPPDRGLGSGYVTTRSVQLTGPRSTLSQHSSFETWQEAIGPYVKHAAQTAHTEHTRPYLNKYPESNYLSRQPQRVLVIQTDPPERPTAPNMRYQDPTIPFRGQNDTCYHMQGRMPRRHGRLSTEYPERSQANEDRNRIIGEHQSRGLRSDGGQSPIIRAFGDSVPFSEQSHHRKSDSGSPDSSAFVTTGEYRRQVSSDSPNRLGGLPLTARHIDAPSYTATPVNVAPNLTGKQNINTTGQQRIMTSPHSVSPKHTSTSGNADTYAGLSYEDRLDVIRLSYEDPDVSKSAPDLVTDGPTSQTLDAVHATKLHVKGPTVPDPSLPVISPVHSSKAHMYRDRIPDENESDMDKYLIKSSTPLTPGTTSYTQWMQRLPAEDFPDKQVDPRVSLEFEPWEFRDSSGDKRPDVVKNAAAESMPIESLANLRLEREHKHLPHGTAEASSTKSLKEGYYDSSTGSQGIDTSTSSFSYHHESPRSPASSGSGQSPSRIRRRHEYVNLRPDSVHHRSHSSIDETFTQPATPGSTVSGTNEPGDLYKVHRAKLKPVVGGSNWLKLYSSDDVDGQDINDQQPVDVAGAATETPMGHSARDRPPGMESRTAGHHSSTRDHTDDDFNFGRARRAFMATPDGGTHDSSMVGGSQKNQPPRIAKRDSGYATQASPTDGALNSNVTGRVSQFEGRISSPQSPSTLDKDQTDRLKYFQQQLARQHDELERLGISSPVDKK